MKLIDKDALVAEINSRIGTNEMCQNISGGHEFYRGAIDEAKEILSIIDTLEVKEVDLVIHTIIAECCDWLAMTTNLSHDEIEGCRNLMLTVKDEQLKAQKGEEYDRH